MYIFRNGGLGLIYIRAKQTCTTVYLVIRDNLEEKIFLEIYTGRMNWSYHKVTSIISL